MHHCSSILRGLFLTSLLLAFCQTLLWGQDTTAIDSSHVIIEADTTAVKSNPMVIEADTTAPPISAEESVVLKDHSPVKATVMSALVPGLGQAYNKKYWKIPLIYAALGTSVYFIVTNRQQYNCYKDAFKAEVDDDPNTSAADIDCLPERDKTATAETLRSNADQYQTWMELSYVAAGAAYLLNVLDASVDAHLFYFDVSDDLSLQLQPNVTYGFRSSTPVSGLSLRLQWGKKSQKLRTR